MFISKIATFGKLARLSVPGIIHKPTLQRIKEELVREGGVLESVIEDREEDWERFGDAGEVWNRWDST